MACEPGEGRGSPQRKKKLSVQEESKRRAPADNRGGGDKKNRKPFGLERENRYMKKEKAMSTKELKK